MFNATPGRLAHQFFLDNRSEQQLTDAFYSAGLIPKKVNFAPFVTSAFSSAA
jgi:hypothetical protein